MKRFINDNCKVICTSILLVIAITIVIQASFSYAIDNNNGTIFTRDELSEKVNKSNMFLELYPVGSIYQSTDATSPADLYGGTWTQTYADYDRQQVASQVLHSGVSGTGAVAKTPILCHTGYYMINTIMDKLTIPTGYHVEFRLTAQINTRGNNIVSLYINNIVTSGGATWSDIDYRRLIATNYFRLSDIVLEKTFQHNYDGINLSYIVTGEGTTSWQFWYPTLSAFLTSDKIIYKWERTA